MMGIAHDNKKPYKRTTECHECGERFHKGESKQILKVYDSPWADQPRTIAVHNQNYDESARYDGSCLDKLTDTSWADFRYFLCERCNRLIIQQNPDNGWRSYKMIDDNGEEFCVRCYQENILENGHEAEEFARGQVPGDFYNHQDLSSHDWVLVQGMSHVYITGKESAQRFADRALELIDEGNRVLVNYDSMGIGGGEGYVSLYIKPAVMARKEVVK